MLQQFETIEPVALEVYKGRRVIFAVGRLGEGTILRDRLLEQDPKLLVYLFPEQNLSVRGQREFCTKMLSREDDNVVVITGSPFILSDAFASQIYKMEMTRPNGGRVEIALKPTSFPSFGAEPSRIVLHLLNDNDESIGELSNRTLQAFLARNDWTKNTLAPVVNSIGGGWPRAALREALDKL